MVFGKKKKKEEKPRREEYVYPLYVKVSEQTGITEGRLLVVENRSNSPLMNVVITLNRGTSDLPEQITFPLMKPKEKKEIAFRSKVKAFSHELSIEDKKALAPDEEINFEIIIRSEIPAEGKLIVPIKGYSKLSRDVSTGEASEAEGLEWTFDLTGEAKISINASPSGEVDPWRIGAYKLELYSNRSMSGIEIDTIKAFASLRVTIEKESIGGSDRRVIVNVENPNEFHVELLGRIVVKGETPEEEIIEGILAPGDSRSWSFEVKSIEEPVVEYDIKGITYGYAEYESSYFAEHEGVEIPLLKYKLEVNAEALHDKILSEVLDKKEIPGIGETDVKLEIKVISTGYAPIESVERTTYVDPPIAELKDVRSKYKAEIDGNVRRIKLDRPLDKDESLKIEEIYSLRPTGDEHEVNFEINFTASSKGAMLTKNVSDKLYVRLLRRSVSMDIAQAFEGEAVIYRVQLINTGQMPAINVTLVAEIPEDEFDVDVEPKESEKKKNVRKRVFEVMKPNDEKIVKIRVRPKTEAASFDKIKIYQA